MREADLLVVEDDADMRFAIVESLRCAGHWVREACHGLQALDLMATGWRPHLILLDIIMPVMDGFTFLQRKRQIRGLAEIPVVILSATAEGPIDGARRVLRKPFELRDLISVVRMVAVAP